MLGVLGIAALLACQPGTEDTGATATPTPVTTGQDSIAAIGREYAQCVRDNGVPEFPDMVVIAGQLTLPDSPEGDAGDQALRANRAAQQACQPILERLPASARKNTEVTGGDLQKLLRYAQCVRDNGVPEWPDPSADGSFKIVGTPLEAEGKSARMQAATKACRQYWDQGISVK